MKKLLLLLLLLPISSFAQQEQWTTLNINGKLSNKWSVVMEGEQRYSYVKDYVRYFHYDAGFIRTINKNLKLGAFYRELYQISRGVRVIETRPHVDAFITHGKHWKWRIRAEYQIKEVDPNIMRYRIRPTYELNRWKQWDPFIQTELNFTKYGFTRNRFNMGFTYKKGKFTCQPSFLLESINKSGDWNTTTVIWINNKISF